MRISWISFLLCFGVSSSLFGQQPHWREFQSPAEASLRGLSPVSAKICWAVGSQGTWLRTTDAGVTWDVGVVAGLDSVDFRSIHAWDEKRAIVASAGQPAVIYRTQDGGLTWEKVHQEGSEAFFDAIIFISEKRGFVLGDPVAGDWMVLETIDQGKSWKSLPILPKSTLGEVAFAASNSSMIANNSILAFGTGGSVSNLHLYSLGQQYWTVFQTPLIQGESSQGAFALQFVKNALIAVGGDFQNPDSSESTVAIFQNQRSRNPNTSPSGYRSGLTFWKKRRLLVAVGPNGSDFSTDYGESWTRFSDAGYHAVKVSNDQKSVWASGSDGRMGILIF